MLIKLNLKQQFTLTVVLTFAVLLNGCAHHYMPVTVGMTTDKMKIAAGEPTAKWPGKNGVECWKYELQDKDGKKGGRYYMVIKDGQVISIRHSGLDFRKMVIGLPEIAVVEMMGRPRSVSENENGKYLEYIVKGEKHREWKYVHIVGGFVDSYGTGKH